MFSPIGQIAGVEVHFDTEFILQVGVDIHQRGRQRHSCRNREAKPHRLMGVGVRVLTDDDGFYFIGWSQFESAEHHFPRRIANPLAILLLQKSMQRPRVILFLNPVEEIVPRSVHNEKMILPLYAEREKKFNIIDMKVFWLFNHPAPYKVDLFNLLGQHIELTACFERVSEKGRNELFYNRPALSFRPITCTGIKFPAYQNYSTTPIKMLEDEHYDLIVINGYSTLTEMRTIDYLKKRNLPYHFCINGGIVKKHEFPLKKKWKEKCISGASGYLAPDENSAAYLVHYGAREDKITLYPYSTIFDSEILKEPLTKTEKRRIAEEEFSLLGDELYVSSGQFIKRKGFDRLIKLWGSMPKNARLAIAGEGEEKQNYLKLISRLNLTNVSLIPYLRKERELRLLSAANAFLFPTKEDIYGHVVNEALASGVPVISSKQSNAAKKLVKDGETGYLIDYKNQSEFLDAIEGVKTINMGQDCLRLAKENTLEKEEAAFLEYFQKAVSQ